MTSTVSIDSLVDRIGAVRGFLAAASGHLPEQLLARARTVADRAGERLGLSRDHTVVALAGATGSGKSSLFNALVGSDLSTVGVRRPTTGATHAGIWGSDGAVDLLDWLGVARRYGQDDADGALRGLVLLDLPDFDSVSGEHRLEVDRLLGLVDLVVWVVDPQKYADRLLHRDYLSQFHRHRDITVVTLNQADLLSPSDVERCLADLRGLLAADGLAGVPLLATSTVREPGVTALRDVLHTAVEARLAVLDRLAGDVDVVVADLAALVAADLAGPSRAGMSDVDGGIAGELTDALVRAAGVPTVVRATEDAYRHRAIGATGWPPTRWLRRLRPDPLRRLHLGGGNGPTPSGAPIEYAAPAGVVAATSIGPAPPAARAAVGLAVRTVAERAGAGLPEPWPAAMLAAARSHAGDLTDALDLAVARTDLGVAHRPLWWRAVALVHWLFAAVALVGVGWLVVRLGLFAVGLPDLVPAPVVGHVPAPTLLLFVGLLAGLLLSVVVRPVIAIAARRRGSRAATRLRRAVEQVGAELILAPIRGVRADYAQARAALRTAGRCARSQAPPHNPRRSPPTR